MVVATMSAAACGRTDGTDAEDGATLTVFSTAVADGDDIPVEFTCDGDDVAPDLTWADVPADTVEIAIIVDDPRRPRRRSRTGQCGVCGPTAAPIDGGLPQGAVEGTNDFGEIGYRGPCPPVGDGPHHYRFRVLARTPRWTCPPVRRLLTCPTRPAAM